ncbi:MAG: hypothetical protein NZ608_02065 [candidate division WOR-3 bacterium]|nr:hypothetical protein [candidate division WOR-3 bacterium]
MKYLKLFLLIFLLFACDIQHRNALRIKNINGGKPLKIDIIDVYTIGEGEEATEEEVIWDHSVYVEFIYTEFGIGLPTIGNYTALLTDYEITFEDVTPGLAAEDRFKGEKLKKGCNILIPSDPEGKKTEKIKVLVMPASYIENYLSELEEHRVLKAKIKFEGKDLLSEKKLEAEGFFTVIIGDYPDDEKKKEPPEE